jgi:8-oxo-dGTP diphosphatase
MSDDSQHEMIRYTADVVLLHLGADGEPRVLLIQRRWDPHAGAWALPGGHVDRGETARQAAVRELLEETGIAVTAAELVEVGVYDEPGRDPRGRYVSVAFAAVLDHAAEPTAGDDAALAQWQPVTLAPAELAFDHHAILADAVARTVASASAGARS